MKFLVSATMRRQTSKMATILLTCLLITGLAKSESSERTAGPTITVEPPSTVDFSNTTGARLDCAASGVPSPTLLWVSLTSPTGRGTGVSLDPVKSQYGEAVTDIPGLRHVLGNGSLVLPPFPAHAYRQDIHAATYRCTASNQAGLTISREVRVRAVVLQPYEIQVYDEFVIAGNTAVLKCHIPTFVEDYVTVVSWVRDNVNIYPKEEEGAKYAIMTTGELHVRNVQTSDSQVSFQCLTRHRLTNETRLSAERGRLFVTEPHGSVPPRITDSKVMLMARQGDRIILPCVAQGFPVPIITWYMKTDDGQLVPIVTSMRYRLTISGLLLPQAMLADAALYICVANNTVGSERVETVLTVTAPLSAYIQPANIIMEIEHSVTFQCITKGAPITSLTWFHNGRKIQPSPEGASGNSKPSTRPDMLYLERVSRRDQGVYQCLLSNDMDSAQAAAELRMGDIIPAIHDIFKPLLLHPGTSLSLLCSASGSPQPDILWFLDDTPVNADEDPGVGGTGTKFLSPKRVAVTTVVDEEGQTRSYFNVTDVRTDDGGNYVCEARNKAGQVRHSARIDIFGRPVIRPMPKAFAIAGNDFMIHCPAAGFPILPIEWKKGGRQLPVSHHQVVFPNGTLLLKNVQRNQDAGRYSCTAKNSQGHSATRDVDVFVLVPPKIVPFAFLEEFMTEGASARISCHVIRGDQPLNITWLKDRQPVTGDGISVRAFDEVSSVLTIQTVSSRHNGNYTCVAKNPASVTNYTTELLVKVPPQWTVEPRDADVVAGSRVVLDCQAKGFPAATVEWLRAVEHRPGEYVSPFTDRALVHQLANGSLVVTEARAHHAGQYLCRVSNGVGAPLGLVVKIHVKVPVRFDETFENVTVRRSDLATLRCDAKGELPIQITWFNNGKLVTIFNQPNSGRYRQSDNPGSGSFISELSILRSDRKDTGIYSCQAMNKYGKAERRLHLTVMEPPENPVNLKLTEKMSRSVAVAWSPGYDGNSAVTLYVIQAKLTGGSWSNLASNVTVAADQMMGHLRFLKPSTSYHVRVLAVNSIGPGQPSDGILITTEEEAPSGPPLNVRADSTTAEIIRVSWDPPRQETWNGQILGYYVGYRLYESSDPYAFETVQTSTVASTPPYLDLSGLRKYSRYGVVVQAFNHVGTSPRSEEVVFITSEDVPSAAPQGVQCSPQSSQSLHVSWESLPLSTVHGVLQGYKLVYRPTEEWYDGADETKSTPGTKTVLSGLERYTNYSIRVFGYTRKGDGPSGTVVYCRTVEDVPEAPSDIKTAALSHDSIIVAWKKPARLNGLITKYTVYMRTMELGKETVIKHTIPATQLIYEISGLRKNRRYDLWVTASTSVGEGQSTKVVSQSPVGPAVAAKIISFGTTQSFPWRTTVKLPCKAVGYPQPKREWTFRQSPLKERTEIGSDGTLSLTEVDVHDAGPYTCVVNNPHGTDEISFRVNILVPPSPPVLGIAKATFNSLEIHWRNEKNDGITINKYRLHYKRDFGEYETRDIPADQRGYIITDLQCGTRYHIFMTAINRIGSGNPSEIVITKTDGSAPVAPTKATFIKESTNHVTLNLLSWQSGCPILYFVVQYKSRTAGTKFRLVSNNVLLESKEFVIPDLQSGAWYDLHVTAHNNAGSKVAEYTFATLTSAGTLPEQAGSMYWEEPTPFYYNLTTILLSVSCILVAATLVLVALVCSKRNRMRHEFRQNPLSIQAGEPNSPKMGIDSGKPPSSVSSSNYLLKTNNGYPIGTTKFLLADASSYELSSSDISPYATSQLASGYVFPVKSHQQLQVYPPLSEVQDSKDSAYSSSRTCTLQRLQQLQSNPAEEGEYQRQLKDYHMEDHTRRRVLHNVGDDISDQPDDGEYEDDGRGSESSSSDDEASPSPYRRKPGRIKHPEPKRNPSYLVTRETSFVVYDEDGRATRGPLLHYIDPEFSDTESDRDLYSRRQRSTCLSGAVLQ